MRIMVHPLGIRLRFLLCFLAWSFRVLGKDGDGVAVGRNPVAGYVDIYLAWLGLARSIHRFRGFRMGFFGLQW